MSRLQVHGEVSGRKRKRSKKESRAIKRKENGRVDGSPQRPPCQSLDGWRFGEGFLLNRLRVFQRSKNTRGIRVIPRLAAAILIEKVPAWPHHKDPAKLPGITLDRILPIAGLQGASRVGENSRGQDLGPTTPEPGRTVAEQVGVDENRARHIEVFAEGLRKLGRAVPDNHQGCSAGLDLFDSVAQLRDLLSAKQSTEVAYKEEDSGSGLPETVESVVLAGIVRKRNRPEAALHQTHGCMVTRSRGVTSLHHPGTHRPKTCICPGASAMAAWAVCNTLPAELELWP